MASSREPSDVEQLTRYIATQRLDGEMDSSSRAQLALAVSVPAPLQKLFSQAETLHVMKTVARAIDEAVAAERERCAKIAESHGEPYALHTATGAMMFRALTVKVAAAIRGCRSAY